MNFGKYKGTSLRDILYFDSQYIIWCIKNIPNFTKRIDRTDRASLEVFLNPFGDINTKNTDFDSLTSYLKEKGILKSYQRYVNEEGDIVLKIDTIYGTASHYERSDNVFTDLSRTIVELINRWIDKINELKGEL